MSRSAKAAHDYARMSDVERCAYMGRLLYETRYAYVTHPDRYEDLLAQRKCLRPQQIPEWIKGDADVDKQVFLGGRGSGKTFASGTFFVTELLKRPGYRLECLGPDFKVSVGVQITGVSGIKTIIESLDKTLIERWDQVKNILTLVNGSQVFCLSSEYPGSIEGPEYHGLWVEEIAELREQGGEDCIYRKRAEPGVRLIGDDGEGTRTIFSGTPEATELIKDLHDSWMQYPDEYAWEQLATRDNIANLDAKKVERMYRRAGNSRFAQTKLEGRLILESPNALLNSDQITLVDRAESMDPRQADAVTLMVDSNHSDDVKSDECGMIVHGLYRGATRDDDEVRVHADATTAGGPHEWPTRLVEVLVAYPEIREILVEDDKSLVIEFVKKVLADEIQQIGRPIKLTPVKHRNRSKQTRADPVAALYVLSRVKHDPCYRVPAWADLAKLQWQWTSWNPKQTGKKKKSPDRIDADVYGVEYHLIRGTAPDQMFNPAEAASWK